VPRAQSFVEEQKEAILPFATSPRFLQNNETEFDEDLPWGEAIGAALLINVASLVGLVILIPTLLMGRTVWANRRASPEIHDWHRKILYIYIPSFGAGALLAAAVFLIIPEAIHLLSAAAEHEEHRRFLEEEVDHEEEEHEEENSTAWKFGASLLGGFIMPIILGGLLPRPEETDECLVCEETKAVADNHTHGTSK
jgi:hypothetical protein